MNTTDPLACQRDLFELPRDVVYFDAAAWTPVPHPVRAAGEAGMLVKRRPWDHRREMDVPWSERARTAAAALIGAAPGDVAVLASVSQAMATAARNLRPPPGSRILRIADEFPSHCLPWNRLAAETGAVIEEVARPSDGDWTSALAEAITRPGAPPLAIATLTPLHWSDGTVVDLEALAPLVRAAGAALVIDATQVVGAAPIDVGTLQPDFLAFPTYKWTLGPYSVAFLYAAPQHQAGEPLELHGNNQGVAGARRYDKGEREEPVALAMATAAMELVQGWGVPAVAARLRMMTDRLADGIAALGLPIAERRYRVGHILGVRPAAPVTPAMTQALAAERIFASARSGALRISPHVWADEDDVERFLEALRPVYAR